MFSRTGHHQPRHCRPKAGMCLVMMMMVKKKNIMLTMMIEKKQEKCCCKSFFWNIIFLQFPPCNFSRGLKQHNGFMVMF